ncbi:MAG: flagellar biosynthetic protein FliR [Armatimonadota bacterium]|nr:flagellar biosynthetic protein FliR [Armatimonadota bacterium]MDR7444891.1 flagellar biosynthetic protein FliR [Armatimonadota bacterium]MDR7569110.1 flagellar biosynthetic protein FliR [Armatimonadota bacterium]MDR7613444.1 flagellar biosynthetic protein FliR [Armatimonadota bacterium]
MPEWGFLLPFLLGAARVSGFLLVLPALGGPRVPVPARVGLGLCLAATVPAARMPVPESASVFGALLVKELSVGLFLGWGVALAFATVQVAAQMAEVSLGLGTGHLVDPVHGTESTILAQLWTILATVLYLATDAHHHALRLVGASFSRLPLTAFPPAGPVSGWAVELAAASFLSGVQLAAPFLVASLAVEVGIALAARAAPQVNVFLVSLPLKVGVGLVLVGLFMPYLLGGVEAEFARALRAVAQLLRRGP